MPLLMKRSCERLQASQNSLENRAQGELAGSGPRLCKTSCFCTLFPFIFAGTSRRSKGLAEINLSQSEVDWVISWAG